MQIKGKYSSRISEILEYRCTRKEIMDRDIPITSRNSDGKVTQPVRITKESIIVVHYLKGILTNVR